MGKIYTRFIVLKKQAPKDWFMDKVGLVKFEDDNKKYEPYNKHVTPLDFPAAWCYNQLDFRKTRS